LPCYGVGPQPTSPNTYGPLGIYENFEVGTFVDDLGGQVVAEAICIGRTTKSAYRMR